MKVYMFPGQGAQYKGMGKDLFDEFKGYSEAASSVLGYSIKELCLQDPQKNLNKTQFTQPALYVVNALSNFRKISQEGRPDFLIGHSLGEFNAMLAAESFGFEQGLKIVVKRGELMSRARNGAMAAIMNSSEEDIKSILNENGLNGIDLANYNSAGQIVISGLKEDLVKAEAVFTKAKVEFYPLNTSGAFHSRYMEDARKEFEEFLSTQTFSELKIPVVSNVTADFYANGQIVNNLSSQLSSPVRWSESVRLLLSQGEVNFHEVGPGDVLTKIVTRIRTETPAETLNGGSHDAKADQSKDPEVFSVAAKPQTPVANSDQTALDSPGSVDEKVRIWNRKYPVGTKVKSRLIDKADLETRTEARVLFGHRPAVYLKGYNGYFDIDDLSVMQH